MTPGWKFTLGCRWTFWALPLAFGHSDDYGFCAIGPCVLEWERKLL